MKKLLLLLITSLLLADGFDFKDLKSISIPTSTYLSVIKINNNHDLLLRDENAKHFIFNADSGSLNEIVAPDKIFKANLNDNGQVFGYTELNIPFIWTKTQGFVDFRTKCSPSCLSGKIENVTNSGEVYGSLDFADDNLDKLVPFTYENNILNKISLPVSYSIASIGLKDSDGTLYGVIQPLNSTSPSIFSLKNNVITNMFTTYNSDAPTKKVNNLFEISNVVYKSDGTYLGSSLSNNSNYITYLDNGDELFNYSKNTSTNLNCLFAQGKEQTFFLLNNLGEIISFVVNNNTVISKLLKVNSNATNINYCGSAKLSVAGGKLTNDDTIKIKKNKYLTLKYKVLDSKGRIVKNAKVRFDVYGDKKPDYIVKTNSRGIAELKFKVKKDILSVLISFKHPLSKLNNYSNGKYYSIVQE